MLRFVKIHFLHKYLASNKVTNISETVNDITKFYKNWNAVLDLLLICQNLFKVGPHPGEGIYQVELYMQYFEKVNHKQLSEIYLVHDLDLIACAKNNSSGPVGYSYVN